MSQWMIYTKKADFNGLALQHGITPVLARIMINRGVKPEEFDGFLHGDMDRLYSPWLFKDMETAVNILQEKLSEKKRIRVIGDYDIDGVCATYILTDALNNAGAYADMDIPDRINDGYGINADIIARAVSDGIDTIITCDNGIAALDEIAAAKSQGITVIVTDHHEVPRDDGGRCRIVCADAVIDHKQPDCHYPCGELCGAAVAYKLSEALYERLELEFDRKKYIQPAAIATIGDVVDLSGENRIIAKMGLKLLETTELVGIRALMEACGIAGKPVSSYHIGFILGPCLNASGRLETAKKAYELLNTSDMGKAEKLACELKELNDLRKTMTDEAVSRVKCLAEQHNDKNVLILYAEGIHESIAGIVAGRIREQFYKPVIVLTDAKEEGVIKGSGRSIDGYDMFRELSKCRELFLKFGGHEMAAGLSMKKENLAELDRMVNENESMTADILTEKLWIDVKMPFSYITESFVEELSVLEPFGKGNEKPSFAEKPSELLGFSVMGKNKNVLKLTLRGSDGYPMQALYFGNIEELTSEIEKRYGEAELGNARIGRDNAIRLSVMYYPQINTYNGRTSTQIIAKHILVI